MLKFIKSIFDYISILHLFISLFYFLNIGIHFIFENFIIEMSFIISLSLFSKSMNIFHSSLYPLFQLTQFQNSSIDSSQIKISIIQIITTARQSQPTCITTILIYDLFESHKISKRFRHFLAVYLNITVAEDGTWK